VLPLASHRLSGTQEPPGVTERAAREPDLGLLVSLLRQPGICPHLEALAERPAGLPPGLLGPEAELQTGFKKRLLRLRSNDWFKIDGSCCPKSPRSNEHPSERREVHRTLTAFASGFFHLVFCAEWFAPEARTRGGKKR